MDERFLLELVISACGVVGAWAVVRFQVADLREHKQAIDKLMNDSERGMVVRVTKLESELDSHGSKLGDTAKRLEKVAEDLQSLLMRMAGAR